MNTWYFISVFLHVILAAFWIGGMLSLPLVILPGIKQHPDRIAILYKTGIAFRFYGWVALLALLATGLLNMYLRGLPFTWVFFTQNSYGILVSWKFLLFTGILAVSGTHDFFFGRKALEEMQHTDNSRLRQLARWSGRINLLLALAMAFLGVVLSRGGALP
ncbi:MAG: CopD family protein [Saprospirales bacterium]|nr:CopD family protein [Saprospirales bacterium]MBK8923924.1 CopD family protein [Saprospirales bacterium]